MVTIAENEIKHLNSSEKWLLAIPVVENGITKLRCYMRRRGEPLGTFQDCYTYIVSFNTLCDFFSYKSHGQAYNELIKYKKQRTGFISEADHIKGTFLLRDIKDTILDGKTNLVFEAITYLMNLQNRNFIMEAITEAEKKEREVEKQRLAKLEEDLMNLGYDY